MELVIYLDNVQVASKTISLATVGDSDSLAHACGSITVTYDERINYRDYNGQPSWQDDYVETVAPAQGYRLVRHVKDYTGTGTGTPPSEDVSDITTIVFPYTWGDVVHEYHNVRRPEGTWIAVLKAYFEKIPREPTNLLLNSVDHIWPIKLVYDPNTNKLVCDA